VNFEDRISRLEAFVERQAVTIAARDATIEGLVAENTRLQKRVTELESKLGGGMGESGSQPPKSPGGGPKRMGSARKQGAQPGHKGHRRDLLPAEQVTSTTDCFPERCRNCSSALPHEADPSPLRHQVVNLPARRADVDEYRLHRVTCDCGTTTCATLPRGVPRGMLGPGLVAFIALVAANCHVSRRKVKQLLSDMLGLKVSLGALSESEALAAAAVAAPVEEALHHALAAKAKHADGTTWYRRHAFESLWVMATKAVTVFAIFGSATKDVLEAWLGGRGILVSDRGTNLSFWAMERRQVCWAHLIRKFAYFAEQGGEAGQLGAALLEWARRVLHEWHLVRDGTLTRSAFARRTETARAMIEVLLHNGIAVPGIGGSCANIYEHRAALWRFVTTQGIEPTNNHAEQELRGFVLWRKTSLGSQSARGDLFAANMKSVIHTCRKQGLHVLDFVTEAITTHISNRPAPSLLRPNP
jgi:transposase